MHTPKQTWCANIRCVDHCHLGAKADDGLFIHGSILKRIYIHCFALLSGYLRPRLFPVLQSQGMAGIQSQRGVVVGQGFFMMAKLNVGHSPVPKSPDIIGVQA